MGFGEMILNMTDTTRGAEEDYTGEDGRLLREVHKPGYFPQRNRHGWGRDRHPAECDCQRAGVV